VQYKTALITRNLTFGMQTRLGDYISSVWTFKQACLSWALQQA